MIDIELFAEYLEAHSASVNTINAYSSILRKANSNEALKDLATFHKFINSQRKEISQKSFNLLLVGLRAALRFIDLYDLDLDTKVRKEIVTMKGYSNPIPVQERRSYSRVEIDQLLQSDLTPWRWQAIWTMLTFGMRKTELRMLKLTDIDLENNVLNIPAVITKSKRSRSMPISSRNKAVIESWLKLQGNREYYLELRPGKMISSRSLSHWKGVDNKIGFKIKSHNLRYTFATNLYLKTNDIVLVQKMLGHSNPSVTSIYLKLTREDFDTKFLEADLSFI